MTLRIDRCVCTNQTFVALLAAAKAKGLSLEELGRQTGAGKQCTMCLPYLRKMLKTEQTVFHHLLPSEDDGRGSEG